MHQREVANTNAATSSVATNPLGFFSGAAQSGADTLMQTAYDDKMTDSRSLQNKSS